MLCRTSPTRTDLGDGVLSKMMFDRAPGVAIPGCAERNRSVWIGVTHDARLQRMEIQAFLKFGLSGKFGQVEDVCPAASLNRDAFIVRFVAESSVSLALAFGGGLIPEKNIRLLIRPVHRSKWMKNLPYQQARPLPPVPVTHQQPTWMGKTSSSTTLSRGQTEARGPSRAPSPTHSPERGQPAVSSSPKSAEVLPQATVSGESVKQEGSVPNIEPTSASPDIDHSRQFLECIGTHDQAASREIESPSGPKHDGHPKPGHAFPRTTSPVETKQKKKKDVAARPKSALDDAVSQESNPCIITLLPGEGNGYGSSQKAQVTLPDSPLGSSPSSAKEIFKSEPSVVPHPGAGNGSPPSKSQERQGSEHVTPERTSSPHLNTQSRDIDVRGNKRSVKGNKIAKGSLNEAHAAAPKVAVDPPATVPKPSEIRTEPADVGSHMRASSIFTAEEIKERRQAWNRIPMPLDPRKSKKAVSNAGSSQTTTPRTSAPEETDKKENVTSCDRGRAHSDPLESSSKRHYGLGHSMEGCEGLDEDEVRCTVNDECSRLEQGSKNIKGTIGEDASDPALKSPASSSWASDLVEDTGIGPGMGPLSAANVAANQQGKAKTKWNKNKKFKKRPTPAPLNALQQDEDSQGRPPSALDINTISLKGKHGADHETPTPTTATSESIPRPASATEGLGEFSCEPLKDPKEQGTTSNRGQYHYDTLPRGRLDFRQNAGGSLKVSKKRKNKYPSINSKTFEPSTSGRSMPSPSKHATGSQMPTATDGAGASTTSSSTKAEASDASRKSRLNPLATSFESPRKGATAALGIEASPHYSRATSSREGPREKFVDKPQSPYEVNILQRSIMAHGSPTKGPQLRERLNRGFTVGDGHSEVSNKQQENNPPGRRRQGSGDRQRHERENKKPAKSSSASPRREEGKTQANFDAADWPALPASRVRSATLQ
ncbi:hypothetical protein M419DRAFT_36997 [Trichoderma reesei RUT C-30]|uniref:Uncharacterized protein n=1 Tax=Hypocrea jecorina (strain ATCC 56765 / BCRC 32924 / NRRL 11460 / Rut C-30) TaxID=1344414 RepID=A0A024S7H1_HYPJR|nr:hypothetical protein M419DRAFT_36997 [Trichoderma reesei RUT C-30]